MATATHDVQTITQVSRELHRATFALDPADREPTVGACSCGAIWCQTCSQDIRDWYLVHVQPMPTYLVERRIADARQWLATTPDHSDTDALAVHIGRGRARMEMLLEAIGAAGPGF